MQLTRVATAVGGIAILAALCAVPHASAAGDDGYDTPDLVSIKLSTQTQVSYLKKDSRISVTLTVRKPNMTGVVWPPPNVVFQGWSAYFVRLHDDDTIDLIQNMGDNPRYPRSKWKVVDATTASITLYPAKDEFNNRGDAGVYRLAGVDAEWNTTGGTPTMYDDSLTLPAARPAITLKRATKTGVQVAPRTVAAGRKVLVSGSLKRLALIGKEPFVPVRKYVAYKKARVRIYFDPAGAAPKIRVGVVTTDSKGRFHRKFEQNVAGRWSASFGATATRAASNSAKVRVAAR